MTTAALAITSMIMQQKREERQGQKSMCLWLHWAFSKNSWEFQFHPKTYAYTLLTNFATKEAGKCSFVNKYITISNKVGDFYEKKKEYDSNL